LLSLQELDVLLAADSAHQYRPHILASMHSRFSVPVVQVLILVMAMPFFMLREPASPVTQAVKALTLCFSAWIPSMVFQHTGMSVFNPVTAVWLPVVMYLPVAAILAQRTKT
jgi:lipopolysaccharide export LptBFGC system permease protein LptF